jgi:putative inorganic carbon (HCO3(-)) transporter
VVAAGWVVARVPLRWLGGSAALAAVAGAVASPTWAVALAALLVPFGSLAAVGLPGAAATPVLVVLAAGLAGVALGGGRGLAGARGNRAFRAVLLGLGAYLAALALSTWRAPDLAAAVFESARWVELGAALVVACAAAGSPRGRILVAGAVAAAHGGWLAWKHSGPLAFAILGGRLTRAFGTFGQPNPFAAYMNMVWPLAAALVVAWLAQRLADRPQRGASGIEADHELEAVPASLAALAAVAGALCGAGLLLSWSRGGWLAGAAAGAVMAALWAVRVARSPWRPGHAALAATAVAIGLGALLALPRGVVPAAVAGRILSIPRTAALWNVADTEVTDANFATIERVAHWQAAAAMWRAAPWLGQGPGHYALVYHEYRLPLWSDPLGHAHDYYLQALAESGLVGLAGYLAFMAACGWVALTTAVRRGGLSGALGVGLAGILAAIAVHSLVDDVYVHDMAVQLGLVIGLAVAAGGPSTPGREGTA